MPDDIPQTVTLARIFGWALIPFVLSVIFGCTKAGSHRIPWPLDVLALLIGIGSYYLVFRIVEPMLWDAIPLEPHWGTLAALLCGLIGMAVAIPVTYLFLGGRKLPELEQGPAH